MIKRTLIIGLISFGLSTTMNAQELPAPSPYTEVQQRIGLTDFTLSYSRPGVKDRTIFGDLEAYGEIWRTGANRATKLEVSSDAVIGNAEVAAGVYSIFTIPGEKTWRFILNSDINASENSYDEAKNVIDIEVEAKEGQFRESMLLYFDALRDESAELVFEWENVRWTIPVQVASDELAMQNIDNKIAEIEGNFRVYNSSAKYYLDHGKDLERDGDRCCKAFFGIIYGR